MSYDSVDILKKFTDDRKITFALLSDEGSKTIDAYGIRNKSSRTDGIPHPGTFIIDKDGVIKGKIFIEGYRERPPSEEIAEAAKKALGDT